MARSLILSLLVVAVGGSGAEEDSNRLWSETYSLGRRVEVLTESMTTIVDDVNAAIANRRKSREKLRQTEEGEIQTLKSDSKKKLKGVHKKISSVVDRIRELQKSKEKNVMDLLKEKGCVRPQQLQQQVNPNNEWEQGESSKPSTPPPDPCEDSEDEYCQREEIKEAMKSSWGAYRKHAWGWDELMPITKQGKNWAKGVTKSFGLTIHDSLTTLLLMGMQDEFEEALEWIESDFHPHEMDFTMSAFESVIRMVGGLISAYEFSGERHPILLKKAKEVADIVLYAYNTSSGIPHASINYNQKSHGNPPWSGGSSVLSEFGTVQLEFRTLSFHTNNSIYDEKATWIMDVIEEKAPDDMLCPTYFSTTSFRWTSDHITLGALGDSFFEYLLKQYLLTGKTEERYKIMYEKAVGGIMKRLVQKANNKLAYVAEYKRGGLFHKMDHLACFSGGMLALGVQELERSDDIDGAKILKTAEEITETCYHMYHSTPTGVAPEIVEFHGGEMTIPGRRSSYYLLRPETVESFMYLWRITKKQKYRDWGWEVFKALKRWCKVDTGGYSGLRSVSLVPPMQDNLQQSFWLAETLKYLYLLFADDDALDFSKWVLNTEAHPMKIRKRNPTDTWPAATKKQRLKDLSLSISARLQKYAGGGDFNSKGGGTNSVLHPYKLDHADEADAGGADAGEASGKHHKHHKKRKHSKHHHHHEQENEEDSG